MDKIYITRCSAEKDNSLKGTGEKVTPDNLYTSNRIQTFIEKCREENVDWAIFSDNYGAWFPDQKHEWYDKPPENVSHQEFKELVKSFEENFGEYDEILFYHNINSLPDLFLRIIDKVNVRDKVKLFTDKSKIGKL